MSVSNAEEISHNTVTSSTFHVIVHDLRFNAVRTCSICQKLSPSETSRANDNWSKSTSSVGVMMTKKRFEIARMIGEHLRQRIALHSLQLIFPPSAKETQAERLERRKSL